MRKIIYIIILVVLTHLGISSCANGCEEIRESYCYVELLSTSGAKINQLYAYGIGQGHGEVIDTLGTKGDSVMLQASNPQSLEFILNPNDTKTDIRLQMNITLDGDKYQYDDTIHIAYDSYPHLIDMDCGCTVYFDLKEVSHTKNFLREIRIIKSEITNEESLNIHIEY